MTPCHTDPVNIDRSSSIRSWQAEELSGMFSTALNVTGGWGVVRLSCGGEWLGEQMEEA